jgi:hypothetical protein
MSNPEAVIPEHVHAAAPETDICRPRQKTATLQNTKALSETHNRNTGDKHMAYEQSTNPRLVANSGQSPAMLRHSVWMGELRLPPGQRLDILPSERNRIWSRGIEPGLSTCTQKSCPGD